VAGRKIAFEEKAIIRKMLQKGFTLNRVIPWADENYGHKMM
jgi:hypothetical protein